MPGAAVTSVVAGKDVLVKQRVSDSGAHLCVGGVKAVQDIRLHKTGKQKSVLLLSSQEANSVNHETATTENQNQFSSDEQPVNVPKVTQKRKRITKPEERIRAPKFTPAENDVLIQGVVKNYSKLFGRLNGLSVPYESKESIWREIAMNVSAEGVCVQTAHVCKKCYHDCKSNVKRKMALEKKYVSGTGGGSPIQVDFHSWEVPLQGIVCPAGIFGIEGGIDTGNVKNVQDSPLPSVDISDIGNITYVIDQQESHITDSSSQVCEVVLMMDSFENDYMSLPNTPTLEDNCKPVDNDQISVESIVLTQETDFYAASTPAPSEIYSQQAEQIHIFNTNDMSQGLSDPSQINRMFVEYMEEYRNLLRNEFVISNEYNVIGIPLKNKFGLVEKMSKTLVKKAA